MDYSVEYNGKGSWIVMSGDRFQDSFNTQSAALEYVKKQKIFDIFKNNCMDFSGNYEVSPGQALAIAEKLSKL
jgi:hypothetical protein